MVLVGFLAAIGLIWLASGLVLIAVPRWWSDLVTALGTRPDRRFATAQVMILIGLALVVGAASLQTVWLWGILGTIAVLKGMFFLGAPAWMRARVVDWWCRSPTWSHRIAGLAMVGLAVLLTIEVVRIAP